MCGSAVGVEGGDEAGELCGEGEEVEVLLFGGEGVQFLDVEFGVCGGFLVFGVGVAVAAVCGGVVVSAAGDEGCGAHCGCEGGAACAFGGGFN